MKIDIRPLVNSLLVGLAVSRGAGLLRASLRQAALRAAIGAMAAMALVTGAGFLLAAAFLYAESLLGAINAALVIGGILVLNGLVAIALSRRVTPAATH